MIVLVAQNVKTAAVLEEDPNVEIITWIQALMIHL